MEVDGKDGEESDAKSVETVVHPHDSPESLSPDRKKSPHSDRAYHASCCLAALRAVSTDGR